KNPVDDMLLFLEGLNEGYAKSMWDSKKESFKINKKILVSGSFGGSIALGLAAKSGNISHIILQSPIWDFKAHNSSGDEQNLEKTTDFVRSAYKNCYRFRFKKLVKKLEKFEELNPAYYLPRLKELPILVMHDPNDKLVSLKHTKEKMDLLQRGTYLEHYLGHKFTRDMLTAYWKDIDKFIKINYVN
ncbi:MAG TPA: hypothetical protein VI544_00100, partial [Candidatus Nanoarchaeia archaeon]|nr:hypothetical protein [Candidatus Nanoarchaeia archaeon]